VGVEHGKGDYPNLLRAGVTVYLVAAAITFTGGIIFYLIPEVLAQPFLDRSVEGADHVLHYAGILVIIAGIFQLVDGIQAVAAGMLRGLKDARVPMIIALISYWPIGFGIAILSTFYFDLGGVGIWMGFVTGLSAAAIMLSMRFYKLVSQQMRNAN